MVSELKMCRFQRSRVRFLLDRVQNFRVFSETAGESQSKDLHSRKRTVRELIEPLTKILANTYLLQPGNLDGDLSNRLL